MAAAMAVRMASRSSPGRPLLFRRSDDRAEMLLDVGIGDRPTGAAAGDFRSIDLSASFRAAGEARALATAAGAMGGGDGARTGAATGGVIGAAAGAATGGATGAAGGVGAG